MRNAVGRNIPEHILGYRPVKPLRRCFARSRGSHPSASEGGKSWAG